MPDFLDKLNLLLRSSLNNFMGNSPDNNVPFSGKVPPERLGKDIDKEIGKLRQQIDAALSDEDTKQGRLDQYQRQIDDYDQQIDIFLRANNQVQARYLMQQMERQRQLASILKADLDQHRQATSELIERVNMLDAMISDARRQQPDQALQQRSTTQEQTAEPSVSDDKAQRTPGVVLSDLLRNVRERIEDTVGSRTATPAPITADLTNEPSQSIKVNIVNPGKADTGNVPAPGDPAKKIDSDRPDDDLAKRRSRLSKPD